MGNTATKDEYNGVLHGKLIKKEICSHAIEPNTLSLAPPKKIQPTIVPALTSDEIAISLTIPNVGNTCYIGSSLIALFSSANVFDTLLITELELPAQKNLQLYLRESIVNKIRNGQSICDDDIEQLRVLSRSCGWENDEVAFEAPQQDAWEFVMFLLDQLSWEGFSWRRSILHGGTPSDDDLREEKVFCLDLPTTSLKNTINDDQTTNATTVKVLLDNYLMNSVVEGIYREFDNKLCQIDAMQVFRLSSINAVLPIVLKRVDVYGRKDHQMIDIPLLLDLSEHLDELNPLENKFFLKSIICHAGNSITHGHYYSYVFCNSQWLYYNDEESPQIKACIFSNEREKIAREAYILFYETVKEGSVYSRETLPPLVRKRSSKYIMEELQLPCEICNELFSGEDLEEHQFMCSVKFAELDCGDIEYVNFAEIEGDDTEYEGSVNDQTSPGF